MKKAIMVSLVILLVISVSVNIFLVFNASSKVIPALSSGVTFVELKPNGVAYYESNESLVFDNANSRETYFTIHNVNEAYAYGKGAGIKVGILDWGFAPAEHKELYYEYKKFANNANWHSEHGFWMAAVLREIAPECEIYALDTYDPSSEEKWVDAMIEAIDWAIDNKLDILTLSHQAVSEENLDRFNAAIDKAFANGIVTTFINNSNNNNILPYGLWDYRPSGDMARVPDVNILHYDYNPIYNLPGAPARTDLFLSYSSTSPVTGGFIAILKSINNTLSPAEYKNILVKTSYALKVKDALYGESEPTHVVDIEKAALYIKGNY